MNKSKINLVALLLLTTFLFHGVSCEAERTDQISTFNNTKDPLIGSWSFDYYRFEEGFEGYRNDYKGIIKFNEDGTGNEELTITTKEFKNEEWTQAFPADSLSYDIEWFNLDQNPNYNLIIQNYNVVGDTYEAEFSNDWKVCKFRNYKAGGSEAIAYYKLD